MSGSQTKSGGAEPRDDSGYWLQRLMVHADLRLGRRLRLFGQLKSGIEAGRVGGPRRPDEDQLESITKATRNSTRRWGLGIDVCESALGLERS